MTINTAQAEEHWTDFKGAMAMGIPVAIWGPSDTRLAPEIPFYLTLTSCFWNPKRYLGWRRFCDKAESNINTAQAEEHWTDFKGAMAMGIPVAIRGPSDTRLAPEIPFYL